MRNGKILLIILFAALLIFFLYSIFNSKHVSENKPAPEKQTVDLVLMEKNYKKDLKAILDDYSLLLKKEEIKPEEAKAVRDKLLALIVPSSKYKEMHKDLVLSAGMIASNIQPENRENVKEAIKIISRLKANNIWLN